MGDVSSKTTDFVTILYITFIYDSVGKLLLSTKENQTALNLKSDRKKTFHIYDKRSMSLIGHLSNCSVTVAMYIHSH